MNKILLLNLLLCLLGCKSVSRPMDFVEENIDFARKQIGNEINIIEASGRFLNPVTLQEDGSVYYCGYADWRSGFFPGSVWYLYELTGDENLLPLADKYSRGMEEAKNLTWHHDVGFMIYCSFGNGYRLTGNPEYVEVIVQAAQSLSTRFREVPGIIQSWDVDRGWMSERGWECPVIIDNMMNLEPLFEATRLTGDSTYYQIAVVHADRALEEQFRPDGCCYHVIDYDLTTGAVRNRHTAQGYAHESVWSRGQAWAVYGYTVCYRETGEPKYIQQAIKTFKFMKNHPAMPADCIPYWDMEAPAIPDEFRDVSTAACMASALYEMSTMDIPFANRYKEYADRLMESMASDAYRAKVGENGNFLLMHSVGSIPHGAEVDKPLNYADYYFLEALKRKQYIEKGLN
ncbi:MAG: glycoside hydrolase family 88 protein [Tannerellaceae bacterium]|nr:glycoside hydrolase family 88 protein [Tannerellaceae bacterium]